MFKKIPLFILIGTIFGIIGGIVGAYFNIEPWWIVPAIGGCVSGFAGVYILDRKASAEERT